MRRERVKEKRCFAIVEVLAKKADEHRAASSFAHKGMRADFPSLGATFNLNFKPSTFISHP